MPLGLKQLAEPIQGLEAILVTTSQDDLLFDAWSRTDRIATDEDAAGYLGLFVRTRKEVLDALGFKRAPIRASIETDDRIILFRHAEDEFLIVAIFHATLPFGLARIHADELQRAILQKLIGKERVELPSFESKTQPEPKTTHEQKIADELLQEQQHPESITTDDDELRIPMPDVDSVEPSPTNESLLFESLHPTHGFDDLDHEADDDVAFAIGNIEPEHFEADAVQHVPAAHLPAADGTTPSQPQGAPTMTTREIIVEQIETHVVSHTTETRAIIQQKAQTKPLDDVTIGRLRMTYEGGRADAKPCDTPTEQERAHTTNPAARMISEGGPAPARPYDTATERERKSAVDPTARMTSEGGPAPVQPCDTATENGHHTHLHNVPNPVARIADNDGKIPPQPVDRVTAREENSDEEGCVTRPPIEPVPTRVQTSMGNASTSQISRWDNEGGGIALQPFDTPTVQPQTEADAKAPVQGPSSASPAAGHPLVETGQRAAIDEQRQNASRDIVASVHASKEQGGHDRIIEVINYVTEHVPNPKTAHARLAIHARVPLELVHTPQRLNIEQMTQLEEAAKIMLGVEKLPL